MDLFEKHFDSHVDHVHKITGANREEIRHDLRHTRNPAQTIERIFNGTHLQNPENFAAVSGTANPVVKLKKGKQVVVIDLESDDEPKVQALRSSPRNSPKGNKWRELPIVEPSPSPPRREPPSSFVPESDPICFTSPIVPERTKRIEPEPEPRPPGDPVKPKVKPMVVNLLSSDDEFPEIVLKDKTTVSRTTTTTTAPSFSVAGSRTTTSTTVRSTSSYEFKQIGEVNKTATTDDGDITRNLNPSAASLIQSILAADLSSSDLSDNGTRLPKKKKPPPPRRSATNPTNPTKPPIATTKRRSITDRDSISLSPPPRPKKRAITDPVKIQKAAEKATEKARKDAEKAARKAEKAAAATEKANAQLVNSVNKLRSSKKESIPEMIVCPSNAFAISPLCTQLKQILESLGSRVEPSAFTAPEELGRVLVWDRMCKASYDDTTGLFTPLESERRVREEHLLWHLTATEYANLVQQGELVARVRELQSVFPPCSGARKILVLLEGYTQHLRALKNASNRRFAAQVRGDSVTDSSPAGPSEEELEKSLLVLQMQEEVLIHHTACQIQSAEQIASLTGDLASAPYRKAKEWLLRDVGFVAEPRTGRDARDTFVKMLQEIAGVKADVAEAVVAAVGDVGGLVRVLERDPAGLEEVEVGSVGRRAKVGKAVVRRLKVIWLGADEGAMEL